MFEAFLPPLFGLAAVFYIVLAAYMSRTAPGHTVGMFMLLLGIFVAGGAFSYGATDPNLYGIGRVLTFLGAGFIPVAFFAAYKQLVDGEVRSVQMVVLSVVPAVTLLLTLTNPWHSMIWQVVETANGLRFTDVTEHRWFTTVHAPYSYSLFAYAVIALSSRLSTISPAHRAPIVVLLVSAVAPFLVSAGNVLLGIGPIDFPFTISAVVAMLPLHVYAATSLKVFGFSPLAYETLFNHVRDPIIVLDEDNRILCVNSKAAKMLGKPERELLGHLLWEDFPEAQDILQQAEEMDLTQTLKFRDDLIYEVSVAPLLDKRGRSQGTVVVCRDVTQRRRTLSQLADNEHLIRTLIETSSNGILRFALDDDREEPVYRCIFANRAAEEYLREDADKLVGAGLSELSMLRPDQLHKHFTNPRRSMTQKSFELSSETEDGKTAWLRVTAEPVGKDFSVTILDITQRKENEDRMLEQALRDPLTSVLNRRGFEAAAKDCLRHAKRAAVIYLDLNGFKRVNDEYGHHAGDALLKAFGHRLGYCLRPEDVLGRLGGDEFAIVLPEIAFEDVRHISERLIETGTDGYIIKGDEIHCSVSVGIAMMPDHGEELWHLVSVADQAMYTAKSNAGDSAAANEDAADDETASDSIAS